jgi:hypothetical protein
VKFVGALVMSGVFPVFSLGRAGSLECNPEAPVDTTVSRWSLDLSVLNMP